MCICQSINWCDTQNPNTLATLLMKKIYREATLLFENKTFSFLFCLLLHWSAAFDWIFLAWLKKEPIFTSREIIIFLVNLSTIIHKNNGTNGKFCAKVAFPRYTESVKIKAEKQLQNENHTEDWALGSHPSSNGHVTH